MADILDSGNFRILSLTQGNTPVGVNVILPGFQNVCVGAPVQEWGIRKASDTTYLLNVGGYPFTGVDDMNVVASVNPGQNEEWQITPSPTQNAYTIARATQPMLGWTSPDNGGNIVALRPIMPMLPTQLFLIQRIDG